MNDSDYQIYGEWAFEAVDREPFPVGQILGARVFSDSDGVPQNIQIQILPPKGTMGAAILDFPYLEAMALLSILKSSQLDTKTPFPDDPRHPDHRR